ncbi:MAG: hypothetical protein QOG75_296 [Mycobacterium sp.]|jgi:hypothetical protein|nr:hypothetical protein [Mycobacterium sp.]
MPTTHPPPASLPRLVRDIETIDAELRLLAPVRRACRELGGTVPSIGPVDALLDEHRELTGSSPG